MTFIGYNYNDMTQIYSTREAAEKLGLSPDHVKLLARKGLIKAKKLGHDWVGTEHLLLATARAEDPGLQELLAKYGMSHQRIRTAIPEWLSKKS